MMENGQLTSTTSSSDYRTIRTTIMRSMLWLKRYPISHADFKQTITDGCGKKPSGIFWPKLDWSLFKFFGIFQPSSVKDKTNCKYEFVLVSNFGYGNHTVYVKEFDTVSDTITCINSWGGQDSYPKEKLHLQNA